ncbi:TIM barrel protein [Caloramator sp. CAR-1]|uniref:sugar phosphate isomerase/epimerase family protein n=1 Tax=Caloramator sp. CAR-1 TaxID=3062777 RepID=UPI0026E1932F|nr:TIM barrel protein [Caloramator sp. CAR-1]MDO6354732.1 TIM barrel protein [Caloramator sp. CAR-1]
MKRKIKNSVGIWAFGPTATRFVPGGYHVEVINETMEEKTERVVNGLMDYIDGFEYHYPNEINEKNIEPIKKILDSAGKDIYCLALGHHVNPNYALGSFINPNPKIRREAIDIAKAGIDMAGSIGANFIIWPGGEGYNYPFQTNYEEMWNNFINAIAELTEHANKMKVTIFLEHKNSEPAMKIAMRNIGMTLYVINKIKERGVDTSNLKVNMDWQHLIMNGENLAEYARLLAMENKLGHHHANSGWGLFDDDNMVGALCFMETLELAKELQEIGYGKNGERIGYDLFPYTENQIEAVKQSVINWEFIYEVANKIDNLELKKAKDCKDAVKAIREVYKALGANC